MSKSAWLEALKTTSLQGPMGMSDRDYHRWLKQQYKDYDSCIVRDKLARSLCDVERTRVDAYDDSWKHYGFICDFDDDLTDEEIDDWFYTHMRVEIHSAYDCTGRPFTSYIRWHRNPSGAVSYIHCMELDV